MIRVPRGFEMEKEERLDLIRKRTEFFFNKKTTVFVKRFDNQFYGGLIIEIHEEFIVLHDRLIGEVPIYFKEISAIEPFKNKEGKL